MLRFINIKLEADSESDVDRWDNLFFIFFMKRLTHANKTLKSTYTLKTQGYLYILCLLMLFFKDLSTNIKNKVS